ncbi:hypothetical protein PBC6_075 [Bacillus phage PBC6]|nr:hypothetical protein PBC6_075 [Bacillus phage PBC6]
MKESITTKTKHVLREREDVMKVDVFLTSGQVIEIYCKEAKFEVIQSTGAVKSYVFNGVIQPQRVNIRIDLIAAYTITDAKI